MSRRPQGPCSRLGACFVVLGIVTACDRDDKEKPELTREEAARILAKMREEGALPSPSTSAAKRLPPKPSVRPPTPSPPAGAASEPKSEAASSAPTPSPAPPSSPSGPRAPHPSQRADTIAIPDPVVDDGPFIVDEPVPIAPAGPITATAGGVVMYNRAGQVVVARLGGLSHRAKRMKTPVTKTSKSAAPFPLGRGPAVVGDRAYWITQGRVVRRKLRGGALEVIAEDAQNGSRVAGPAPMRADDLAPIPPTIAYIVRAKKEGGPLGAKLWVEGGQTRELTPEGSSTHSVTLVHTKQGALALSVQARMSMTPVHARPIEFVKNKPVLHEDVVVWVGGGVQPMTEMAILPGTGNKLWGFIPHEESITRFGLARLDINAKPDMKTPTSWVFYPNGLDPAPADGGYLCGQPIVAYVEPQNSEPDAAQRLVLRQVGGPALAQVVAEATAFFDISYAEVPRGGLVAYVADWVTWAATVRCKSDEK